MVSPIAIRAAIVSVAVAVILLVAKAFAAAVTGSAAILSDALESIVNVVAAGFGVVAIRVASRPPDDSHPYGHGKIEFFAAGFEGGMIGIAALLILVESGRRFFVGSNVEHLGFGIILSVAAAGVNLVLGLALVRIGRRVESPTLVADGRHVLTDVITTGAAVVGLGLVQVTGWTGFDPLAAVLAGLWILRSGWHLVREAVAGLMDEADPDDVARLAAALEELHEPRLLGYVGLRSRHQGRAHLIDLTIHVPEAMSVQEGHGVATRVERALEECFEEATATCHVEPLPHPVPDTSGAVRGAVAGAPAR